MEKAWALLWTECRPAFRFPRRIFRFTSTAGSRDRTALPQNGKNPIPFRFYPALSKEKRPVPRFPWWYGMRISIPKITATLLPITDRATPTIRLMQNTVSATTAAAAAPPGARPWPVWRPGPSPKSCWPRAASGSWPGPWSWAASPFPPKRAIRTRP